MPASSKYKALALDTLQARKKPIDSQELASLLGVSDSNLVSHHLLEFWKDGQVIRSETGINKKLYYLFGSKQKTAAVGTIELTFTPYKRNSDASEIKSLILETLDLAREPLALVDICEKINPNYTHDFYKKICFHLIDLQKINQIVKVEHCYTLEKYANKSIDISKLGISSILSNLLKENKSFFTSELVESISNKYKLDLSVAAVSVTLNRLYSQGLLHRSRTAQTDAGTSGYIWGKQEKSIEKRIEKIHQKMTKRKSGVSNG